MTETEDRLETAMKNVKQAKVMLSEANCAINAAQAERAELRRENERLAKPQLPEGIEWPRFELSPCTFAGCNKQMRLDLVRRAKALAKEGE